MTPVRLARRALARSLFAILLLSTAAAAQAPFTIEDVLAVANASIADVSPDGRHVLVTSATLRDRIGTDNYRYGDPTYVPPSVAEVLLLDTRTGERTPLLEGRRQVRGGRFSPDGSRVALLVREGDDFRLALYDVATGSLYATETPAGRLLSETSPLEWTRDGASVLVALRTEAWRREARARFEAEVKGPIVVRSSEDPFLSWEEVRRLGGRQIPALYDVAANGFRELGDEATLAGFAVTADGETLRLERDITAKTNYEEIFGREIALDVRPVDGGEARTLFASTRGMRFLWSEDGERWVYGKEGSVFAGDLSGGEPRKIAGPERAARDSAAAPPDSAARAARRKERFTPVRLSPDGGTVIATNSEGFWFVDTRTGERTKFLDAPMGGGEDEEEEEEEDDQRPRWSVLAWSRDGGSLYLEEASRTAWERAIHRLDRRTLRRTELVRGAEQYGSFRLSDDGSTAVFTKSAPNRPAEVWTADAELRGTRRLLDPNPWLAARALGEARLVSYLDVDGERLHGVLYLPPGWREGTPLPTVFLVYEEFFDARFNATVALLNADGYAVMQPSVRLERGFPGEAWLKGVTAAANKLIDLGVADPDKLGVHGTSYGGYATNLLVTQTDRFKAAINISGKVDMISFYTDSPRLGTRNIHAPERSQDRIGATLWEQPQKYVAHSAVMFADRIDTPLLLLTGQQDHNVPERTTSEMFYALRRLGKRVEWVSYVDGGHGMPTTTEALVVDYHQRILGWYDRFLKGVEPAKADGG